MVFAAITADVSQCRSKRNGFSGGACSGEVRSTKPLSPSTGAHGSGNPGSPEMLVRRNREITGETHLGGQPALLQADWKQAGLLLKAIDFH